MEKHCLKTERRVCSFFKLLLSLWFVVLVGTCEEKKDKRLVCEKGNGRRENFLLIRGESGICGLWQLRLAILTAY